MAARFSLIRVSEAVVRLALTLVFAVAGGMKIGDPATFVRDIESFRLVPAVLVVPLACYLPWLELVTALALWVRPLRRGAEALFAALTTVFLMALVSAWARDLDLRCGCFGAGTGAAPGYPWLIGRDVVILLGLVALLALRRKRIPSRE